MKPRDALPPARVDAGALDAALEEWRAALGPQWVLSGKASGLARYRDDFAPDAAQSRAPHAALQPANLKQVQKVLEIARRRGVPLWPLATGRNLGYGGAAARQAGVVMLDLQRMNRVLEINEALGYALVEPGVSHLDLQRELTRRGSALTAAPPAAGWGSVLGNLLERGHGYTPRAEQFDNLCGLQLVLADGTVVETGLGARERERGKPRAVLPWRHGLPAASLFGQANFAVVTRLGLALTPRPAVLRAYRVSVAAEDDLRVLVERLRPLLLDGVVAPGGVIVNLLLDAALVTTRRRLGGDSGPLAAEARARLGAELGLGAWNYHGAFAGTADSVAGDAQALREALRGLAGARLEFEDGTGSAPGVALHAALARGVASTEAHAVLDWVGAGAHLDVDTSLPLRGDAALAAFRAHQALCDEHGLDYLAAFQLGPRDLRHRHLLVFARDDAQAGARVAKLYRALAAAADGRGEGVLRTHLDFMDDIAAQYAWSDQAWLRTCESLKDALDPGGLLAPGKSGLWPGRGGRKRD
ncbi:MAG: FAD-binding oxidoreductase [Gammaproteobacteria bacterium]|nr:FAD-binding oxidoreductase [Gammaproteobacteria bacterium]